MMPHIQRILQRLEAKGQRPEARARAGGQRPDEDEGYGILHPLFFCTHPSMLAWRPRAMPSAPGGTSLTIDDPAATYAPSPILTGATSWLSRPMKAPSPIVPGATSWLSLPMKAPSPITVRFLLPPS